MLCSVLNQVAAKYAAASYSIAATGTMTVGIESLIAAAVLTVMGDHRLDASVPIL
jgi:hypothetical protein